MRAAAKNLVNKKDFADTDSDAQKIIEAYGTNAADLKHDVVNFVAQGTHSSVFDSANNTDEKFKWDRVPNLQGYNYFDAP